MGPVAVATMFQAGIGEPASKKLHPFFSPNQGNEPHQIPSTESTEPNVGSKEDSDEYDVEGSQRKRRKTDSSSLQDDLEPKKQRRKSRNIGASLNGTITSHLNKPLLVNSASDAVESAKPAQKFPTPPLSDVSTKPTEEPTPVAAQSEVTRSPMPDVAKKVLKFNPRTGTLGSPPKPKQTAPATRIISIKYGQDDESRARIGAQITQILQGKIQPPRTPTKKRGPRTSKKEKGNVSGGNSLSKTAHPFFTGKTANKPLESIEGKESPKKSTSRKDTVFMSTPVSPRKTKNPFIPKKAIQFGIKSIGTKVPGAMHPLWPAQGMAHVRGDDGGRLETQMDESTRRLPKKSKGHIITINRGESVLHHVITQLDLGLIRATFQNNPDKFVPAPAQLRLPVCHFESGRNLQRRVRQELRTYRSISAPDAESSQDELSGAQPLKNHAIISRFYNSLETQLSAYDRSTCESIAWTQKYAPVTTAQVLQSGKEPLLLKQWLEALKVQSVEQGGIEKGSDKSKTKLDGAPKKRRKKNKLDGFVVDSDEEEYEMDELSDDAEDWAPAGIGLLKKSVVRPVSLGIKSSKDVKRLANAVLISGPHGCGKTAAVHAVAKELGFEIFEINSSTRRSGKDVLEKVGDMTRNHLVQQHSAQSGSTDEELDKTAEEVRSGKQGTMTSFFKAKTTPADKAPPRTVEKERDEGGERGGRGEKSVKTSTPRTQRQSLILVEEVDILYEEDKQFWATLMAMMAQSKRPFIMTCNDESLVPIRSLNLHGIFRFSPPSVNLAVDTCLLIAANEGHALKRSAVEALYHSRGGDLRATLAELNFWCQFGVGDRRGGFDWFFLRWPKGSDLDEKGDVVRVVSEDSYLEGMGWLDRDLTCSTSEPLEAEEDAICQVWKSWQLDMSDWQGSAKIKLWTHKVSESGLPSTSQAETLEAYDAFCSTMSDGDICAGSTFTTMLQEQMDPTTPDIPTQAREDFICGRTLLDADPALYQHCPSATISISIKTLARRRLHDFSSRCLSTAGSAELKPVDESTAVSALDSSFRVHDQQTTRLDLAKAFDPIAVSPNAVITSHLEPSIFDRTLKLIVLDVAPWVRGIVAFDHQLMLGRARLSNILSEGGTKKRMRNTRAAFSALEGGERRTTRREKYFGDCLTTSTVMRTGGEKWQNAILKVADKRSEEPAESSHSAGSPPSD